MKFTKRQILSFFIVVLIAFFLSTYQLPYYIHKPGGADALNPIVSVEGAYESEGDMHLVTVRGGQATPVQLAMAKILPYHDVLPIEDVIPEGITDEDYFQAQLQMMESSQEASKVVAYEAADANITIEYSGVYVVSVLEDAPADGILEMGDRITGIDNIEINEADDLISYVQGKSAGDVITVDLDREEEKLTKEITLEALDALDSGVGIGISLVTDRQVEVDPEVNFSSGGIGGPSAGLMFALEIYDQLTEGDITKGYQIAGTGEVDYDGNVYRIGGIDKKVIAADKEGCDIFFAPNENGAEGSNYQLAKKTAEDIGTDMVIVPVDTFEDALNYLKNME
ncbi:SepM family pheromone-processing serine protease [Ornithinibacillus halophilus]|uniref:endopeptidase La n=1 Tax=Ornithinibacillus halophilus TaxID=930117 RepID=A0A1M5C2Z0_9BACI|nr:SepM family pheromone-processing serine protease [Ornithinibacillus halophilus]SHF49099.1 PDZ domain-containing protein [Ornithinibacillus halophilus]